MFQLCTQLIQNVILAPLQYLRESQHFLDKKFKISISEAVHYTTISHKKKLLNKLCNLVVYRFLSLFFLR